MTQKYFWTFALAFSLVIVMACSGTKYEPLNRDMLNERNQKFWDYYHSLNICEKIDVYDSVMVAKDKYYQRTEPMKISPNWDRYLLHNKYPNNFYGYIFNDIVKVTDTSCCYSTPWIGGITGVWYLDSEYPFEFQSLDSLHTLTDLWRRRAECQELDR